MGTEDPGSPGHSLDGEAAPRVGVNPSKQTPPFGKTRLCCGFSARCQRDTGCRVACRGWWPQSSALPQRPGPNARNLRVCGFRGKGSEGASPRLSR